MENIKLEVKIDDYFFEVSSLNNLEGKSDFYISYKNTNDEEYTDDIVNIENIRLVEIKNVIYPLIGEFIEFENNKIKYKSGYINDVKGNFLIVNYNSNENVEIEEKEKNKAIHEVEKSIIVKKSSIRKVKQLKILEETLDYDIIIDINKFIRIIQSTFSSDILCINIFNSDNLEVKLDNCLNNQNKRKENDYKIEIIISKNFIRFSILKYFLKNVKNREFINSTSSLCFYEECQEYLSKLKDFVSLILENQN